MKHLPRGVMVAVLIVAGLSSSATLAPARAIRITGQEVYLPRSTQLISAEPAAKRTASPSPFSTPSIATASRFDNGEWVIAKGEASIPESPFKVRINGAPVGKARLLTFANRVGRSDRFPQVLVISSSGYLRMKSGGDPSPPLPFGQSLVLGPAIFGSSGNFPDSTLFFNPQVQQVNVNTSRLHRNGKGPLEIDVVALDRNLPATDTHTNQVMNLRWKTILAEPTESKTQLRVDGTFRFAEAVMPDPARTSELQSFRLVQVSSMFIDSARHDVTGLRYRAASGPVEIAYSPNQANALLPATASPLAAATPTLDSIDADNVGLPNGNAPSYRIRVEQMTGPLSGPLIPRAYFNGSQDLNDDNLGLWIYRQPAATIPAGARGRIRFKLTATADPLPKPSRQVRATASRSSSTADGCWPRRRRDRVLPPARAQSWRGPATRPGPPRCRP